MSFLLFQFVVFDQQVCGALAEGRLFRPFALPAYVQRMSGIFVCWSRRLETMKEICSIIPALE